MIEKALAAIVVAMCAVMMLRLVIGARRRQRLDALFFRLWFGLRARGLALWRWPRKRRQARQLADDAIRRASQGEWDGNVYKPKSFKRPPRDKMH